MTVSDIVKDYLTKNGYDGVVNRDMECGCSKDDFPLCQDVCDECEPAYRDKTKGDDYYFTTRKQESPHE